MIYNGKKSIGAEVALRGMLLIVVVIFNFLFSNAQERLPCSSIRICYPVDGVGSETICFYGNDTVRTETQNGLTYKAYFKECKGKGVMETYKNNKLLKRQYFVNGLDTLKRYIYVIDPVTLKEWIEVRSYFEALEDGEREYWNNKRRIYKREKYTLGLKSR